MITVKQNKYFKNQGKSHMIDLKDGMRKCHYRGMIASDSVIVIDTGILN